jgi:hypothetical protein
MREQIHCQDALEWAWAAGIYEIQRKGLSKENCKPLVRSCAAEKFGVHSDEDIWRGILTI